MLSFRTASVTNVSGHTASSSCCLVTSWRGCSTRCLRTANAFGRRVIGLGAAPQALVPRVEPEPAECEVCDRRHDVNITARRRPRDDRAFRVPLFSACDERIATRKHRGGRRWLVCGGRRRRPRGRCAPRSAHDELIRGLLEARLRRIGRGATFELCCAAGRAELPIVIDECLAGPRAARSRSSGCEPRWPA